MARIAADADQAATSRRAGELMTKDIFTLPTGETVKRIYGVRHPGEGTTYLNAVRATKVDEASGMASEYRAMKPFYGRRLAEEVKRETPDFDAVLSPPSNRQDAVPYRDGILSDTKARDLTGNFSRHGKIKAADDKATVQDVIGEFIYKPDGSEGSIKSLLIVDESTASGKTVAAVLHHLRAAGLPETCSITIAVWARLGD